MKKYLQIIGIILIIISLLGMDVKQDIKKTEILVLCAGSMRAPIEEIIKEYNTKVKIFTNYGDSAELCSQIKFGQKGDIYVCHDPFMEWAEKQGFISTWQTVGKLEPVIVVPISNPKEINSLNDLSQPGIRLGIGDRTYSTCGILVKNILKNLEFGEAITKNICLEAKSHQQLCTAVIIGNLDAVITWNPIAQLNKNKFKIIPIPQKNIDAVTSATYGKSDLKNVKVTVGIISTAKHRKEVKEFYKFIITKGKDVFKKCGFAMVIEK